MDKQAKLREKGFNRNQDIFSEADIVNIPSKKPKQTAAV